MPEELSPVRYSLSASASSLEWGTAAYGLVANQSAAVQQPIAMDNPHTPGTKLRVLMVEDNPADVDLVLLTLRKGGFEVFIDVAQSLEEFTSRIRHTKYDLILADHSLPQTKGTNAPEILGRENLDVPLIVMTGGSMGEEKAVDYIKQGATDLVLKDRIARLPPAVRRALREKHDRDQRRQFEKQLADKVAELARSNAELARSNEELEQFAYVASQDLQEPLRMLATYSQMLAERYRGKLDEQADKCINYAVDGALRLQALIHDLLTFSRAGKAEIELRLTDCSAVVEQAVESLRPALQDSGAVVNWKLLPLVMVDPGQLTQVFQNLIANAIKFNGSKTPVIQISAEKKDQKWLFAISDNSIGIPAESRQDAFVIFRRLHSRIEYAGNGIGLSICNKIIERHGGKLWVEAQAAPGCCFRFTLPAGLLSEGAAETKAWGRWRF